MSKTGIFLVMVVSVILLYDLWAFVSGGVASTVSTFIKSSGYDHPFIILAVGYFAGHFFSPMKCPRCQ
jgi:hypothetical protein